jgi:tRNA-specific 2-thiouridylase
MASKVLIAMSGSYGSSLCAALMKSQGYDCVGVYLDATSKEGFVFSECQKNRLEQVQKIAKKMMIPLHVVSVYEQYERLIVDTALHRRVIGQIYNTCFICKTQIFFPQLFELMRVYGCEALVLGLYAQIVKDNQANTCRVYQALDKELDQSSMLSACSQEELALLMMPLGGFSRLHIERLSEELGFKSQFSPASYYCVGKCDAFSRYLLKQIPPDMQLKGVIRFFDESTQQGFVVGDHNGFFLFHYGQLLYFPDQKEHSSLYVIGFEQNTNTVIVGKENLFYKNQFFLTHVFFVTRFFQFGWFHYDLLVDGQSVFYPVRVLFFENGNAQVESDQPVRFIFPGVIVFFYSDQELIFSAVIA